MFALCTPAKQRFHHSTRRRAIISLTPLIDVVFILLVFFMLASSFLDWHSIVLDTVLPPATSSNISTDKQPLLLSISTLETRLDGEVLPMTVLLPRLQQRLAAEPDLMVHVQPIDKTPLQAVVAVLDQLQAANITGISMIRDSSWTATNDDTR